MTQCVRLTTRTEREALRSIKRACFAGLDSLSLRQEVGRQAGAVVRSEAYSLVATDPQTGLFTHGWGERLPEDFVESYMSAIYPMEVDELFDFAFSGVTVREKRAPPFLAVLRAHGLEHALHSAMCVDGGVYASWCVFRERGSPAFAEHEMRFVRAIAPHLARGMRAALLRDSALEHAGEEDAALPGVLVLDARGRILLRSGPAAAQLADLADIGVHRELIPYAVVSVLARLATASAGGDAAPGATLHARGLSGRRYTLRASLSEPDASGESSRVVVIEPAAARPSLDRLSHLYGLTPREAEVLVLVVRGASNKRISADLHLSVYTVQDHLSHACEKVGVRGRKALLAKLFFDGYSAPDV
jgi:DNA-binding CsgD family transcriptional regulator